MIKANQPLRAIVDSRQRQRRSGKLDRATVNARDRIETQSETDWRSRTPHISKQIQVQVEPGVGREERAQPGDRRLSWHNETEVLSGAPVILLKTAKEERLVPAHRAPQREAVDIAAEDG